ncbi:MAG: IPT/TIG domain-containing protein [Rikenellaceae bacterium]
MNYIKALFVGALCTLFASCQEDVYVATVTVEDPIVTDFEPKSGEVGTEVTIYGENLHIIKNVYIGGGEAPIKYRIDQNQMVVTVSTDTRSGGIEVINNFDTSATYDSESFTVTYKTPVVESVDLPKTENEPIETEVTDGSWGEVGQMVVFYGEYLHFVDEVLFGDTPGTIITQREDELVVEIPLMDVSSDVDLTLTYFDGSSDAAVDQGLFHVIVLIPQITTVLPESLTKYSPMTLEGYNLDLISSLYVMNDDQESVSLRIISKSANSITIDIATNFFASDYNDDYTESTETLLGFTGAVYMVYNGDKVDEIASEMKLYGDPNEARYTTYKNIYMSGRSNSSYGNGDDKAFLDFDTGVVYDACGIVDNYATLDIMFYDSGANQAKINGAHNSSGTYKNYKCSDVALSSLISDWSPTATGTTIKFRTLDPSDADHKALIDAYEAGTIVYLSATAGDDGTYVADDPLVAAIDAPGTSSPILYASLSAYNAGQMDTGTYSYVLMHKSTPDVKYGIMKVQSLTLNPDNSYGQSMIIDAIWSL